MKHLKLFENTSWSDLKLRQHIDDEDYIKDNLKKYVIWKKEWSEEANYHIDYLSAYFFDTENWYGKDNDFIIQYYDPDGDRHQFIVEDYGEMINFLDNPNMFLDAKKYNL